MRHPQFHPHARPSLDRASSAHTRGSVRRLSKKFRDKEILIWSYIEANFQLILAAEELATALVRDMLRRHKKAA